MRPHHKLDGAHVSAQNVSGLCQLGGLPLGFLDKQVEKLYLDDLSTGAVRDAKIATGLISLLVLFGYAQFIAINGRLPQEAGVVDFIAGLLVAAARLEEA